MVQIIGNGLCCVGKWYSKISRGTRSIYLLFLFKYSFNYSLKDEIPLFLLLVHNLKVLVDNCNSEKDTGS